MDDRELDKILEEIKQHSMQQKLEDEGQKAKPQTDADDYDISSLAEFRYYLYRSWL